MTTQISTIELNPELVNMAFEMGLNVQKTCENGLKEAIKRRQGLNSDFPSVHNAEAAGSNPTGPLFMVQFPLRLERLRCRTYCTEDFYHSFLSFCGKLVLHYQWVSPSHVFGGV